MSIYHLKPFFQSVEWGSRLTGLSIAIITACTIRTGIPYNFSDLPQERLQSNRQNKSLLYLASCALFVTSYRVSRMGKKIAIYDQISEEENLTRFRQSLKSAATEPLLLPESKSTSDAQPIQLKEILQRGVSIILMGNSGCGKSSLIKYFCGEIGVIDDLIICNPHDDGRDFDKGVSVIYKYDKILTTIQQALDELDNRKEMKRQGQKFGHKIYVFDEWPSIIAYANREKKHKLTEEAIGRLGSECRKYNMLTFFCSQSGNVKAMGLEGMGDLLENYVCVRLCKVAVRFARRTGLKKILPTITNQAYPCIVDDELSVHPTHGHYKEFREGNSPINIKDFALKKRSINGEDVDNNFPLSPNNLPQLPRQLLEPNVTNDVTSVTIALQKVTNLNPSVISSAITALQEGKSESWIIKEILNLRGREYQKGKSMMSIIKEFV